MTITVYAIRQKSTGHFLPQARYARRGGFTHDEPVPATERPPRLFSLARHAKCALTNWLPGSTEVITTYSYDGEPDFDFKTTPKPDRKIEDMEVVPAKLVIQDGKP